MHHPYHSPHATLGERQKRAGVFCLTQHCQQWGNTQTRGCVLCCTCSCITPFSGAMACRSMATTLASSGPGSFFSSANTSVPSFRLRTYVGDKRKKSKLIWWCVWRGKKRNKNVQEMAFETHTSHAEVHRAHVFILKITPPITHRPHLTPGSGRRAQINNALCS